MGFILIATKRGCCDDMSLNDKSSNDKSSNDKSLNDIRLNYISSNYTQGGQVFKNMSITGENYTHVFR